MITGLKTLSSKLPCEPAKPTAASLPITCTQTIVIASHCVGLTLPGMIDEPGSFSGRVSSPSPQRGPDASQRMSLAIFISATASVLSAPLAHRRARRARPAPRTCSGADDERQPGQLGDLRRGRLGELRVRVEPGADRRAAERQLVEPRQRRLDRARGRASSCAT